MAINSKAKGKRGELQVAAMLREAGFKDARRSQQYAGMNDDADVVGLPGCHLEVKYREHLNLYEAMEQSRNDSNGMDIPIVVHRKNGKPWLVTMDWESFIMMYGLAGISNGQSE